MKKTNITIIYSTILAIGVIAVLLWVFKEEVMKLWGKLKERYGEWIGGGKEVVDVEKEVKAFNEIKVGETIFPRSIKVLDEMHDNNREMKVHLTNIENALKENLEDSKKNKDDVNKILNIFARQSSRGEENGK